MINAHSPAQLQPLNKEGELKSEGKKLDLNEELRVREYSYPQSKQTIVFGLCDCFIHSQVHYGATH